MSILNINSSSGDGYVGNSNVNTWALARDASSGNIIDYIGEYANPYVAGNGGKYWCWRTFLPFDTSSLPDNCTITGATLSFWGDDVYDNLDSYTYLVEATQASVNELVANDFDNVGSVSGGNVKISDYVIDEGLSKWTITLNATALTWINKTGYTKLALRDAYDLNNQTPTDESSPYIFTSDNVGGYPKPLLSINYEINSGESTITGLSSITGIQTLTF